MDALSKNIVHLAIKLDEVGNSLASMRKRMTDTHHGEAQNAIAEITELEKNFQAEIKDLKAEVNGRT